MVYGLWLSADGLLGQQYRQEVIANNLANVDTPAFKADRVAFIERLTEAAQSGLPGMRNPILDPSTGGLFGLPAYTDFSPGRVIPTENPLDLAILDDGFLTVGTPEGIFYTRDGRLTLDSYGRLRHEASGGLVLDPQNRPIAVDPSARHVLKIDSTGRVSQGPIVSGRLALSAFEDPQRLEKIGQNLYDATNARRFDAQPRMHQFAYEASGVEPSAGLVDMISASRAYQMNATLISMQDETLGRLVNEVARIG